MPKLSYEQFSKRIDSKKVDRIYLLYGEKYFLDHFEISIKNLLLTNTNNYFNNMIFDGENINLNDLENAIDTLPLNSTKKCITIKNFAWENQTPEDIEYLIEIFYNIPEYCTILMIEYHKINGSKNINKFKKIEKIINEKGISCEFETKNLSIETQLIHWAKTDYNKNLSMKHAKIIKEKCKNLDINHIYNELKKICNYESQESITQNSLNVISNFSEEKSIIFNLPKSIFSKNIKKSFETLNSLFKNKEDPIAILAVICSEYIDLYRTKVLSQKNNGISEIIEKFDYKNKEFKIKNAQKKCKNFSIKNLKKSLEYLLEADIKLKSTNLDKKLILQDLIIKIIKE